MVSSLDQAFTQKKPGFTLTELLVVLVLIALLIALLVPVFSVVRGRAHRTACTSNLRQVWQSMRMYVDDNNATWLPRQVWVFDWYHLNPQLPLCPSVNRPSYTYRAYPLGEPIGFPGYGYNDNIAEPITISPIPPHAPSWGESLSDAKIPFPATTICINDASEDAQTDDPPRSTDPQAVRAKTRHGGGANYAFVDGHLQWLKPETIPDNNLSVGNDGTQPTFMVDPPLHLLP